MSNAWPRNKFMIKHKSPNARDFKFLFLATQIKVAFFTLFLSDELSAERRFRRDYQKFFFIVNHLGAAAARGDEIEVCFSGTLQLKRGPGINWITCRKIPNGQFFKFF